MQRRYGIDDVLERLKKEMKKGRSSMIISMNANERAFLTRLYEIDLMRAFLLFSRYCTQLDLWSANFRGG